MDFRIRPNLATVATVSRFELHTPAELFRRHDPSFQYLGHPMDTADEIDVSGQTLTVAVVPDGILETDSHSTAARKSHRVHRQLCVAKPSKAPQGLRRKFADQ